MSHSQFHCTGRVYLDLHGLIFETSICYWQDQPGSPPARGGPGGGPGTGGRGRGRPRRAPLPRRLGDERGTVGGARPRDCVERVSRNTVLAGGTAAERVGADLLWERGTGTLAAASVERRLGQTGRLGLACERATPLRAERAVEAGPKAGGTARRRGAVEGPPMSGCACQSIRVRREGRVERVRLRARKSREKNDRVHLRRGPPGPPGVSVRLRCFIPG